MQHPGALDAGRAILRAACFLSLIAGCDAPVSTGTPYLRSPSCDVSTEDDCRYVSARQYPDLAEVTDLVLRNAPGGRQLPMLVRYPRNAAGPLPVVLWEHAGGYSQNGHEGGVAWSETFAHAGYIVVHVAHLAPSPNQLETLCDHVGITDPAECVDLSISGHDPDEESNVFASIGVTRPADTRHLLDRLGFIARKFFDETGIEMDTSRVAVAGWSGGSQSSMALAGAARALSASLPDYRDPDSRPLAFIAMSPQGPGYSSFYADDTGTSWDDVEGPMLVMTGDGDEKPANDMTGADRRLAYDYMPAGDKYLWYSTLEHEDVKHSTFNLEDATSSEADLVALSAALTSTAVAFVDAFVRDDAAAADWLASDDPAQMVDASWEHK